MCSQSSKQRRKNELLHTKRGESPIITQFTPIRLSAPAAMDHSILSAITKRAAPPHRRSCGHRLAYVQALPCRAWALQPSTTITLRTGDPVQSMDPCDQRTHDLPAQETRRLRSLYTQAILCKAWIPVADEHTLLRQQLP